MIGMDVRSIRAADRDEYQCRAEVAECACPDDCERDHSNE
jgi:hypothetical protein